MNERIRELEKQAIDALRHNPFSMEQFREKFAELIVLACAKVSERTGALNEADFEGEMISDAIKEYFGVEE